MKLVVGLGNPGKKYEKTRHNMGFLVLDRFLNDKNIKYKTKFDGIYAELNINNEKVIFLKPQKYMNNSGEVVKPFMDYFKIDSEDLLIIYDDIYYEYGNIKIKPKGSAGGHNGIKNIIKHINTENFKRIKVGISAPNVDIVDYVLGKLPKDEEKLNSILDKGKDIITDYFVMSFNDLMSKYN